MSILLVRSVHSIHPFQLVKTRRRSRDLETPPRFHKQVLTVDKNKAGRQSTCTGSTEVMVRYLALGFEYGGENSNQMCDWVVIDYAAEPEKSDPTSCRLIAAAVDVEH
jgi:hypothetical protein